jgi:NAD-dependent SIR2 family protein deacetylase
MSYPNAYCVKCGQHTDTQQKHTVLLQNNARALKGVCPSCATEVYKILPKGIEFAGKAKLTEEDVRKYPDAFCVKCGEHTPTKNAHTVIMGNASRAVNGNCGKCGSEVYRILKPAEKGELVKAEAKAEGAKVIQHPASRAPRALATERRLPADASRRSYAASSGGISAPWSFVIAAGLIACIMMGFFAYSLF